MVGNDISGHAIFKQMTSAEFDHVAGFHLSKEKAKVWKQLDNADSLAADIASVEAINSTPNLSPKHSSLQQYREYASHFLQNSVRLKGYYSHDQRFRKSQFGNYNGTQRANAELVNIFTFGSKKYNSHIPSLRRQPRNSHHENDTRFQYRFPVPEPVPSVMLRTERPNDEDRDRPKHVYIGDYSMNSINGLFLLKEPISTKRFIKALEEKQRNLGRFPAGHPFAGQWKLMIARVPEPFTSQVSVSNGTDLVTNANPILVASTT